MREAANRTKCINKLKQIGLAMHAFHDSRGLFPKYGFDFPSPIPPNPNPDPANAYGAQTQGWSALAMLLPFVEQGNVTASANINFSSIDPVNLPLPPKTGPANVVINLFKCPTGPDTVVDYGVYFNLKTPLNPGNLPMPFGPTDYVALAGVYNTYQPCCPNTNIAALQSSGYIGIMGPKGNGPNDGTPISAVTDGTSNTLLFSESSGRMIVYLGTQAQPETLTVNAFNSAWSDKNASTRVRSFGQVNGVWTQDSGCCAINCSNYSTLGDNPRQIYSFHPGGVNALRADGSVFFMNQNLSGATLAALISMAGGEVINQSNF